MAATDLVQAAITETDLRSAAAYRRASKLKLHESEINLSVARQLLETEKKSLSDLESADDKDTEAIDETKEAIKAYEAGVRQHERTRRNCIVQITAVNNKYTDEVQRARIRVIEDELEKREKKERDAQEAELDRKIAGPTPTQ